MKKVFLIMLIGVFSISVIAQTTKPAEQKKKKPEPEVPANVKSAFAKEYPDKTAKWELEDGNFEAEFKINGVDASAVYDKTGHKRELELEIEVSTLPAAVLNYIKKNFPDSEIKEASKITDDKNVVTYEAEMRKGKEKFDLIFDDKGNFIKREKGD